VLLQVAAGGVGGVHGDLGVLLAKFMHAQVPELSEHELGEVERMLRLTEAELLKLKQRPGVDELRPRFVRGNTMLDRFLNFARFYDEASEFR
jgi:succinate dehydrogenase flavin-adding protein (antitoxin of CptAB toxin-antitoxin module)